MEINKKVINGDCHPKFKDLKGKTFISAVYTKYDTNKVIAVAETNFNSIKNIFNSFMIKP